MERMDFTSFCETVRDRISEYLLQYEIEKIRLECVQHNNGVSHTGLVILRQGESVSPTIYLEQYYAAYQKNMKTMEEVLSLIVYEYKRICERIEEQGELSIELEHLKEHVFLRLVNYEKNRDLLQNCPYIPFYDMAITFRYLVKMDTFGIASALLDFDNLKKSALSVEQLYGFAKANTIRLFPPFVKRLDEFLQERYPQNITYPEEPEVYILSNQQFIYGATMMVYKDVIEAIAEQKGKNLYIVPSSVNEVLLCFTETCTEREMLENTLREVNELVVSDTDYLSDQVYFYDKELGNIVV